MGSKIDMTGWKMWEHGVPESHWEIIEEDKIIPQAQPKVDVTKVSDTELEIKFDLATRIM